MRNDVLIVEDDVLIATDLGTMISDLGVPRVRIAAHAAEALAMIADHAPAFALLDIGLDAGPSFEVADRLDALKIPYAFVTGYSADIVLANRFHGKPVIDKPFLPKEVEAVLRTDPEPAPPLEPD